MITFNPSLLYTSIAVAASLIVGFVIYLNDYKNTTNRIFFYLSITTSLWIIFNFLSSQSSISVNSLVLLRTSTAFAVINSFLTFYLFYVFPEGKIKFNMPSLFLMIVAGVTAGITLLTPLVFTSITALDSTGSISTVANGPAIPLFSSVILGFNLGAFAYLFRKSKKEKDDIKKKQLRSLLLGSLITFPLIIIFNFILPAFLGQSQLIAFAPLFVIPFMAFIAYAIIKYHLFNARVIGTELVTFSLWIFILIRTIISSSTNETIVNGLLLGVTIIVGILLIKSVFKEVRQREKLEVLTNELKAANEKLQSLDKLKTEFLSLASHQLRSPLTAIKGYASMVLEGDFGALNPEAKGAVDRIFQSSQNLSKIVEDLLNVSKIEQGGMKYEMAPFNLSEIAGDMAKDLSITAEKKNLKLTYETDGQKDYMVNGDKEKIRQVVLNLIDNSIKYTKEGTILVSVSKKLNKIIFSVKDTGMGMTDEIKQSLFQKFARGDGARMNTGGSGLGLYLAKEIAEAHKGRVWVESPGPGKGSTFFMELEAI